MNEQWTEEPLLAPPHLTILLFMWKVLIPSQMERNQSAVTLWWREGLATPLLAESQFLLLIRRGKLLFVFPLQSKNKSSIEK